MKTLNADIKNKNFRPVYLLYGDEAFLKRSYRNRLKTAVTGGDELNYLYFEGKDTDVNDVISAAVTMPFFSERKLIVVENSGWFKNSCEVLTEYLADMNPSTCLVFIEEETDKRNKNFRKVSESGYACELSHPSSAELSRWAAGYFGKAGKKITQKDMELFLSCTGDEMERVRNEMEKLISYLGDREVITAADIREITSVTVTNRIFDMVRAISSHRVSEAMKLYEDLLALKEPPMRILSLIARQFSQLLSVKDAMAAGKSSGEIAAELKVPAFAAEKMMKQVRSSERTVLLNYLDSCVELEELVKTGDMPERLAAELIISGM